MELQQLLSDMPDKTEFTTTTTHKFKEDLWNFFNKPMYKDLTFVEFGTATGHTTKLVSYLFKEVHTINIGINPKSVEYLAGLNNVHLHAFDLYKSNASSWKKIPTGDVFLIDAKHTYHGVLFDINSALTKLSSTLDKKILVFDDYGAFPEVKKAVDESIQKGRIKEIARIGHPIGYNYGKPVGSTTRTMSDSEGIICQEV